MTSSLVPTSSLPRPGRPRPSSHLVYRDEVGQGTVRAPQTPNLVPPTTTATRPPRRAPLMSDTDIPPPSCLERIDPTAGGRNLDQQGVWR